MDTYIWNIDLSVDTLQTHYDSDNDIRIISAFSNISLKIDVKKTLRTIPGKLFLFTYSVYQSLYTILLITTTLPTS